MDVHLSPGHLQPGHLQVLISLGRGPCSIRRLSKALGASSPAVTQPVNHLEEHKIVERHHDLSDRGWSSWTTLRGCRT